MVKEVLVTLVVDRVLIYGEKLAIMRLLLIMRSILVSANLILLTPINTFKCIDIWAMGLELADCAPQIGYQSFKMDNMLQMRTN